MLRATPTVDSDRQQDAEVRREDQQRISRFSTLHQRETGLVELVQAKQKDKDDVDEVAIELELVDEADKVMYRVGTSLFWLPQPEALSLLSASSTELEDEVSGLEQRLVALREEMAQLKVVLYQRFGRSINLEA